MLVLVVMLWVISVLVVFSVLCVSIIDGCIFVRLLVGVCDFELK